MEVTLHGVDGVAAQKHAEEEQVRGQEHVQTPHLNMAEGRAQGQHRNQKHATLPDVQVTV